MTKPHRHRVTFAGQNREAESGEAESLLAVARRAGVRLLASCGGRGTCGACRVKIVLGEVHGGAEDDGWHKACRSHARSDLVVEPAPRSMAAPERADVDSRDADIAPDPLIHAHDLALEPATVEDPRDDARRLLDALAGRAEILDLEAARTLSGLLRDQDWQIRAFRRGPTVIAVAPRHTRPLGLAVDLGTTNIAGYLVDLETGARVAARGLENPQTFFGADVVSRITHAVREPEGGPELRRVAGEGLAVLARELCAHAGVSETAILDAVIGGNTAMQHLLLGLPVKQLGHAPFVPALSDAVDVPAAEVGLALAPGARVHLFANVGGFVGGDHVAMLLAIEKRMGQGATLALDIGTNTEISLIDGPEIVSISCPSGPALEGGHIMCGMRAANGAIERVWVEENGTIGFATIGNQPAVGLCGSGILDAVAAFAKAGLIEPGGRIQPHHPQVVERRHKKAIRLEGEVVVTQDDIRAVQLAKAAIRAGIDHLLKAAGRTEGDLARIIVAGAFGAYIDIESAVAIGLLPDILRARIVQVGNAAGLGARMALVSGAARARAGVLARRCRYLELAGQPDFQTTYLARLRLDPNTARKEPT
ncbi:MAG: DUF4445 domain-containing protein [Rhodospirillales bacterium]|nr:DUF4445 domain-containing protein [Rhodospirillales bacterium]